MSNKEAIEAPENDESIELLNNFVPIAKSFLENQAQELAIKHELGLKQLEIQKARNEIDHEMGKEDYKFEKFKFSRLYSLLVGVLLFIGALVYGLVFYLGQIEIGLSLLSHIGILILGLLSGMGIERVRAINANQEAQDS